MPITVKIVGSQIPKRAFGVVFDWLEAVDARFSPFKPASEVSQINAGLPQAEWSEEMRSILARCAETKRLTNGYFDPYCNGKLDPSGLVKGWAVKEAADRLLASGYSDFYIDAGGDIQVHGRNAAGLPWRIGVRNPFNRDEVIKIILAGSNEGVATSGAYIRGDHIYNPVTNGVPRYLASVTIIGLNVYEADRFATAIYAMGERGAVFAEQLPGIEAYLVRHDGTATLTSGLHQLIAP